MKTFFSNRRGKIHLVLSWIIILFLIGAYITLQSYYATNAQHGVTENIGGKQEAIIAAVREGERVQLFTSEAAETAAEITSNRPANCGDPYLGHNILGDGSCSDTTLSAFRSELYTILSFYPGQRLTAINWNEPFKTTSTTNGVNVALEGKLQIPIGNIVAKSAGTFSGTINTWPTDDMRVTSLFGNRNIDVEGQSPSKNHPGLDIGADSKAGTPVQTITAGDAIAIDHGDTSYVLVTNGDIKLTYMHVIGNQNIPRDKTIPVKVGDIIGTTAAYSGGPHVHLQIEVAGINKDVVEKLWPDHSSVRTENSPQQSYASYSSTGTTYLDPVCFFDRNFITGILQSSGMLTSTTFEACDAYEAAFGFSERFASTQAQTIPQQVAQTSTSTDTTSQADLPALVVETKNNIAKYSQQLSIDISQTIKNAAAGEGIDEKLILAIITQETQGVPNAISPTGAAGIAQITSSTAKGYPDIFQHIVVCCTGAQEAAGICAKPGIAVCNAQNDDRFNVEKSIQGEARIIEDNVGLYTDYDQGTAFAIAAYNGGPCPVNYAIDAAKKDTNNKQPSWDDVKNELEKLPSTINCGGSQVSVDKAQIIAYTDAVQKWYLAWGGTNLIVSPYTSEQIGQYELNIKTDATIDNGIADALQTLHEKIQACDTSECISAAIQSANTAQYNIHAEDLSMTASDSNTPAGQASCFTPQERALAFYANQFQWCLSSPQDTCSCPYEALNGDEAQLDVSAGETKLTKLGSQAVDIPSMEGLANQIEGDDSATNLVSYLDKDGINNGIIHFANGVSTATNMQVLTKQKELQTIVEGLIGEVGEFTSLYKVPGEDAVGFTNKDDLPQCILPKKPMAYCIEDKNDPTQKAIFYVDMNPHSKPQATITITGDQMLSPQISNINSLDNQRKITFTANPDSSLPYAHIAVTSLNRNTNAFETKDWYSTIETVSSSLADQAYATQEDQLTKGELLVLRFETTDPTTNAVTVQYEALIPASQYDGVSISFLDENLRETQAKTVDPAFGPVS